MILKNIIEINLIIRYIIFEFKKDFMEETILLIDYENIQKVNLSEKQIKNLIIKIFVGNLQNKITFDLVKEFQKYGNKIEWIKIEGTGINNLDFHISYYLGLLVKENVKSNFIILTKDKGLDLLIKFLNKNNITCKRINSILEIDNTNFNKSDERYIMIKDNLSKIEKIKRPKTRKTLNGHINSLFINNKITEDEKDTFIDQLFIENIVSEENNKLTFNL